MMGKLQVANIFCVTLLAELQYLKFIVVASYLMFGLFFNVFT